MSTCVVSPGWWAGRTVLLASAERRPYAINRTERYGEAGAGAFFGEWRACNSEEEGADSRLAKTDVGSQAA